MASSIDPTKPITGNPTTLSVRDNFSAAKTEIEALQTDKADLASPALTGTATAVNLTVSGTLTGTGTVDFSSSTVSLPNDSTITAASDPTFVVKDSDAATEDAATGYFEVQAAAGEVCVRYGNDGSRAVIDVDPNNGLVGAGEFRLEISGNPVMHVDADGVFVGEVQPTEPPADFTRKSLIVGCDFDSGMTLYNTAAGFGDTVGIDFVQGDAVADTAYGELYYDLGDATFSFDCDGTNSVIMAANKLTVNATNNTQSVVIKASGASDTTGVSFNNSLGVGKGTVSYNHSSDQMGLFTNATSRILIDATRIDMQVNTRLADGLILQLGTSADMELHHTTSVNYIDLNVGNLLVRDGTTTRFTFARTTGDFTATGDVTAYSDLALKKDLETIDDALDKIAQLTGYTYTRKDTGQRQTGLIAQDVQKVLPEAAGQAPDGTLTVAYGNLAGLFVNGVNALADRLEAVESEVEDLKALLKAKGVI